MFSSTEQSAWWALSSFIGDPDCRNLPDSCISDGVHDDDHDDQRRCDAQKGHGDGHHGDGHHGDGRLEQPPAQEVLDSQDTEEGILQGKSPWLHVGDDHGAQQVLPQRELKAR